MYTLRRVTALTKDMIGEINENKHCYYWMWLNWYEKVQKFK